MHIYIHRGYRARSFSHTRRYGSSNRAPKPSCCPCSYLRCWCFRYRWSHWTTEWLISDGWFCFYSIYEQSDLLCRLEALGTSLCAKLAWWSHYFDTKRSGASRSTRSAERRIRSIKVHFIETFQSEIQPGIVRILSKLLSNRDFDFFRPNRVSKATRVDELISLLIKFDLGSWAAAVTGAASFSARSLFACTKIPSKPGLERLVITIVSRKDQKQLCLVRLKGATAIGSILNCIVHEVSVYICRTRSVLIWYS